MSTDRTTEILNYLSAISREVGEFRQEFKDFRAETNARLDKIEARLETSEREQRKMSQRLTRIDGFVQIARADIEDLQDRVETLEGQQS